MSCCAGGGPTGVETAAELHDMFADDLLPRYFPHLKVRHACTAASTAPDEGLERLHLQYQTGASAWSLSVAVAVCCDHAVHAARLH